MAGTLVLATVVMSSIALVAMALGGAWLSGWYDERARRALAAIRRGASWRSGFSAVHGVVKPMSDAPSTPGDIGEDGVVVRRTRTQIHDREGAWHDLMTETSGSPFLLVTDGGEEIEVSADRVALAGFVEVCSKPGRLEMRVSAGDEVWVTGLLSKPRGARHASAYRRAVERRRITAPVGRAVEITVESPVPGWVELSSAHRGAAGWALASGVALHVLAFAKLDLAFATSAASLATLGQGDVVTAASWGIAHVAVVTSIWRRRVRRARARCPS